VFTIRDGDTSLEHRRETESRPARLTDRPGRDAWPSAKEVRTPPATCPEIQIALGMLAESHIFDGEVIALLKATGLKPGRTSRQAPRQNGIAERGIGSCCREVLDHIISLNEQHPRRLIHEYVRYHQEDRIHDWLDKDTPDRRAVWNCRDFCRDVPSKSVARQGVPSLWRVLPVAKKCFAASNFAQS